MKDYEGKIIKFRYALYLFVAGLLLIFGAVKLIKPTALTNAKVKHEKP